MGYRLDSDFWGQGLATEAVKACLKCYFEKFKIDSVLGIVELENKASIRVLEKVGMEFVKESILWGMLVRIYQMMRE